LDADLPNTETAPFKTYSNFFKSYSALMRASSSNFLRYYYFARSSSNFCFISS
jgi:hypothetical protein